MISYRQADILDMVGAPQSVDAFIAQLKQILPIANIRREVVNRKELPPNYVVTYFTYDGIDYFVEMSGDDFWVSEEDVEDHPYGRMWGDMTPEKTKQYLTEETTIPFSINIQMDVDKFQIYGPLTEENYEPGSRVEARNLKKIEDDVKGIISGFGFGPHWAGYEKRSTDPGLDSLRLINSIKSLPYIIKSERGYDIQRGFQQKFEAKI